MLHAVPKAAAASKSVSRAREQPKSKSRLEKIVEDKGRPRLPEPGLQYLVDILVEIGPALASGLGPTPITQGEIADWQHNTGIELTPWEARALRRLSSEYIAQARRSEDPNCPPPDGEITAASRERVAKLIDEALGIG